MSESPFERLRVVALVAAGYAAASLVWIVAGDRLPGQRWLAIHLFTLGVVTNLVLALSDHFARTLTHQAGGAPRWQPAVLNLGVLAVLWGIPAEERWSVAAGATVVSAVVLLSYVRLRRLRRSAVGPRFGWVVRMYERAHGAFLHGALLGALLGAGVLAGRWYAAGRIAHLHVMLLGWGGLTLLATMVFFGPTVARIRIEAGADARAARALRWGAAGVTAAALALLGSGVGGGPGTALRVGAAVGLAAFAWAVVVVCLPVIRALRRARASAGRWGMLAAATWFPVVAWADVVAVATGERRFLEAVGVAFLLGVLAQAILAALGYLAPLFRARGRAADPVRDRLETLGPVRALAWNVGVVLGVVAVLIATPWVAVAGWALVVVTVAGQALLIVAGWRASLRTP